MFGHGAGITNWSCGSGVFFPGPLGMIVTLLFWGLIIALVIWLFQSIFRDRNPKNETPVSNNSLNILSERYARGEITTDEFNQMKTTLT